VDTASLELGSHIGLIGDVHGNRRFLEAAIVSLVDRGATSLVQLGDWGMIWTPVASGREKERRGLELTNELLGLVDLDLLVVLGNHENYNQIDAIEPDNDGIRRIGRICLLPRSGQATAAGRHVGWLAGAGSIDRGARRAGMSWWPAEIPSDDEAAALGAGATIEVLFAHDALSTVALDERLAHSRDRWYAPDVDYAERTRHEFTARALQALADNGIVVSGHYHFRFSATERLLRPDGEPVLARSEILAYEWTGESVGLLDTVDLTLETWGLGQRDGRERTRELLRLLRATRAISRDRDSARELVASLPERTWSRLASGHVAVPTSLLQQLRDEVGT